MIKQTKEGFWVIERDTHFTKWVEEAKKLDHDDYVLNIIKPHLGDGAILDIGANIGTHTYAYSKIIDPSKIIAIEPNSECCECLKRNVKNCHILNYAISDKVGEAEFLLDNCNIGASYFVEGQGTKTYSLDSIKNELASLVKNIKFSFIKMDIEGYEFKAITGAQLFISENRPKMWLEVNVGALERAKTSEHKLLNLIQSLNYKIESYPFRNQQYDILCLPA